MFVGEKLENTRNSHLKAYHQVVAMANIWYIFLMHTNAHMQMLIFFFRFFTVMMYHCEKNIKTF